MPPYNKLWAARASALNKYLKSGTKKNNTVKKVKNILEKAPLSNEKMAEVIAQQLGIKAGGKRKTRKARKARKAKKTRKH